LTFFFSAFIFSIEPKREILKFEVARNTDNTLKLREVHSRSLPCDVNELIAYIHRCFSYDPPDDQKVIPDELISYNGALFKVMVYLRKSALDKLAQVFKTLPGVDGLGASATLVCIKGDAEVEEPRVHTVCGEPLYDVTLNFPDPNTGNFKVNYRRWVERLLEVKLKAQKKARRALKSVLKIDDFADIPMGQMVTFDQAAQALVALAGVKIAQERAEEILSQVKALTRSPNIACSLVLSALEQLADQKNHEVLRALAHNPAIARKVPV
jgi:hypothetical protein